MIRRALLLVIAVVVAACGGEEAAEPVDDLTGCAHVTAASIEPAAEGFSIEATVLSADTGWEKYADAWEVRDPDGNVLGIRVLTHPHVDEQPFTRGLSGVEIPAGIAEVTIIAHDSVLGFCGGTLTVEVP